MKKLNLMLWRMIVHSKGQFAAVVVIIVAGIAVYSAMSMTAVNLQDSLDEYYSETVFPDLFIQANTISNYDIESIEKIEDIELGQGRLSFDVPFLTGKNLDDRINFRIISTKGPEDEINRLILLEGKWITDDSSEIILLRQFAEALNLHAGDTCVLQMNGKRYKFEVAGVAAAPEYIYLMENQQTLFPDAKKFGVGYISERFAQQIFGYQGKYNELVIKLAENANKEAIIDNLKDDLKNSGLKQITKKEDQLSNSMVSQELTQLSNLSSSIPILFLCVAGIILVMMIGRMVKRDRIKIGIIKALGYSSRRIVMHYVQYAFSAGLIGGILGSLLGMAISGGMTRLYLDYFNIPMFGIKFYYTYAFGSILLAVTFCCCAGLYGARGAGKLTPASSMKSEPPKKGKRIFLERIKFLWTRFSFSQKLICKNIFRNKKRTAFVLTGVVVTYGMMLFTLTMPQVIDDFMNKHFIEFQKMDYNISFNRPVFKNSAQDLEDIIDIEYMEGRIEYPFELTNGTKKQAVNIIGLEKNTKFYVFKDKKDNEIQLPRKGMLISENLAKYLDVKTGDLILVKTFLPGKENVYIPVSGIIKQIMGMNAYMEIDYMGKSLMEKNIITGVYINSKDPYINSKLSKASNIMSILSTKQMRAVFDQYLGLTTMSIGFMVLFSGILGFCIVYNATIVGLGEREMELSTLRLLGFKKGEIFLMIVWENTVITILGILLGVPVGKWFAMYSAETFNTKMYTIEMNPTLMAAIFAMLATIGFVFIAQLATYKKIHQLDFLQALKNRES